MKVAIIAASNIRFSPYISYYTSLLDEAGLDYELIYPDRVNVEDGFSRTAHKVEWNRKKPVFFEYRNYAAKVKKIVNRNRYDFLIVLTTNIAAYMAKWLRRYYPNKYIVDIRDYTHENILPFFNRERIAVKNSSLNVISSKKFEVFLPRADYHVCHNTGLCTPINEPRIKNTQPITIGYIGQGNYLENCKILCDKVCLDKRFKFAFYGLRNRYEILRPYEQYENISFHGVFSPDEKPQIIDQVDILFNVYGNGIPLLDYALSNKLYDAFAFGKPILTSPGTYMSSLAGPYAFDVDISSETLLDDLFAWYSKLDNCELSTYAQDMFRRFSLENQETKASILRCLEKNSVK